MKLKHAIFMLMVYTLVIGSAPPALAGQNVLYYFSEPGGLIALGAENTFTDADGTFGVSKYGTAIHIVFSTPSYDHFWALDLQAADGAILQAGSYVDVQRYPFQTVGHPGLDLYGDGSGCNSLTGSFDVLEVAYDGNGFLTKLAVNLEQYCGSSPYAIFGQVRINSNLPVTPVEVDFVTSQLTGVSGAAPFYTCFIDLPAGEHTSWLWDFGDGITSTLQNPCHLYTNAGSYDVTLTANGLSLTKNGYISTTQCQTPNFAVNWILLDQPSVQAAYDTLQDYDMLAMKAINFSGDVVLDHDIHVELRGGADCYFSSTPAFSTIGGSFTIAKGTATLENLILQ